MYGCTDANSKAVDLGRTTAPFEARARWLAYRSCQWHSAPQRPCLPSISSKHSSRCPVAVNCVRLGCVLLRGIDVQASRARLSAKDEIPPVMVQRPAEFIARIHSVTPEETHCPEGLVCKHQAERRASPFAETLCFMPLRSSMRGRSLLW